jgi:hypothetical protein
MRRKIVVSLALLFSLMAPQFATAAQADFAVPEKVHVGHRACQEIMRLGNKYKVEGIFSEDFVAGRSECSRIDVAAALHLLTEKMAERVVKEGSQTVDREDLVVINDLKEELRGEMLLVGTKTFQSRYHELGTNFTALTKNISLSGGLVGVLQGSVGNKPKDYADVVGRADLVFNFKVGENTIAVIDVEATGGDGIDAAEEGARGIYNFSALNGVAGSTGDRVRFREAWVEHTALDGRLTVTAGKVDLSNYFDSNAVANDENGQFLAGAFVHSAVLPFPANGPGARIEAKLAEPLIFGLGYGSGDADSGDSSDSADIFDHGFGVAELGYTLQVGELFGNYRIYGSLDGSNPETKKGVAYGVSLDQQITSKLTLFARYGEQNEDVYDLKRAWSAGGQYVGLFPNRADDVLGFAYGQIQASDATIASQEKLAELYYKIKINDQIEISPHVQYLVNPAGNRAADDVVVLALRSQVSF